MNVFIVYYVKQDKHKDAESLLLEAVEGRCLKLGDEHPHKLESWHTLIELYEARNRPEQAEQ